MIDERETFLSCEELLKRAATTCRGAAEQLAIHAGEANARYRLTIESIAETEAALAQALERYAADGPEEMRATCTQYAVEQANHPAPDTLGAAVRHLVGTNEDIGTLFHDQALTAPTPTVGDALESVCIHVEAVNRSISRIWQSGHDL